MKKHQNNRLHFLLACVIALLFSAPISAQNPAPKLTAAEWQADLKFLAEAMPRQHPNLFRRMKREDFEAAVKELTDRIPTMSDDEIVVGIMRLAAMVKDGHTSVFPANYFQSGIFPVRFYLYKDGLFVQKAAPEYSAAVGGKVVKIGNLSADEALKTAASLVFADNEMAVKENAPVLLSIPEVLAGLKINSDKQNLKITVKSNGAEKTFQVKPTTNIGELLQPPANWADAAGASKNPVPLYLKDPTNFFWFEYDKDKKLIYVQQNAVANKKDETVGAFYKRVFDTVAANPVEKFVLDLRNNDGGNNGLNRQVVRDIIKSKIDGRGQLFVITGRRTFSAAQNFVNELEKYTNAIFVGEPTAGRPNHYGDGRPVTLPNSKINVQISTLYWQDMDPRDSRKWTAPEIAVEISSTDYRNNFDPVLQAILDFTPGKTMPDLIAEAVASGDIARFINKYRDFKRDAKNKFVDTEANINRFGYDLLQKQKADEAVEIFKLNAESYPDSANVFDSLGDGYQAAGRKEEAIKAYEKALSIDPNYASSAAALKKLKGQ